jgi:tRNA-specific 2-thiouridylase
VGGAEELMTKTLTAKRLNWIAIEDIQEPIRVQAKIRHKHQPAWATVERDGDGSVKVTFDEAQRSVTPGQAVVFFQDDLVVGGGWIC